MYNISEIAAELGVSGKDLNKFLLDRRLVRKRMRAGRYRTEPSEEARSLGAFKSVVTEVGDIPHWQWNAEGRRRILSLWRGEESVAAAWERGVCSGECARKVHKHQMCLEGLQGRNAPIETAGDYSVSRTFDDQGRLHSIGDRPARVKTDYNGTVRCEEWFQHGHRHRVTAEGCGAVRRYDADGLLIEKSLYRHDKLYSRNGAPCTTRWRSNRIDYDYDYADHNGNVVSTLTL